MGIKRSVDFLSNAKTKKVSYWTLTGIYIFINALFICKYGERLNFKVSIVVLLILVYGSFIGWVAFVFKKKKYVPTLKRSVLSVLYWLIVGVFTVIFSVVVFSVDGESLSVDRWSALELTVQGITENKYPYSRTDHLGNMSSNFPALGFLGLPFYLLGDVGYLQVLVFALFAFFVFQTCSKRETSFCILLLYLSSPALIWEIIAKSDLVSNLFLVFLFIAHWRKRYQGEILRNPLAFGASVSFLLLTRAIVIIPLMLIFFRDIWQSKMSTKIRIGISAVLIGILICLPTFISAQDWETLIKFNPLSLQANKVPIISYLLLFPIFFIPWITKKYNDHILYSALIIFAIPLIGMLYTIVQFGGHLTLFESKFDISYLSMCIPPILIWIKNSLD
ncbi:hypothetical protein [Poritiphilus flavus]|uniref:DUF2029 domain-containing protein n=1 Tax=Poritiphilus flavus TaxID=2697053 RepID=A0A6L9EHA7_9FLAO|nr:hypothetical protein [Poritiphilus flavus]NAS14036.1 hypothetical protein [Poritiphilus flavus]